MGRTTVARGAASAKPRPAPGPLPYHPIDPEGRRNLPRRPPPIDNPFTGQKPTPEPADVAARRAAARAEAERWRLPLQVHSDEALDSEWGDVGRVHFRVHDRSLGDPSFQQRWAALQCT